MTRVLVASVGVLALGVAPAFGQVQTFPNDYAGFASAAGPLTLIDFETLPNGQPSVSGTAITALFNYNAQGAHFSAPAGELLIAGNSTTGFSLRASVVTGHTWIDVDLSTPVLAVGAFFPGDTTLCAFDASGAQIACVTYGAPFTGHFVGIVSDIPIFSARFDEGVRSEDIESFVFSPVPEPGTGALLIIGLGLLRKRFPRFLAATASLT